MSFARAVSVPKGFSRTVFRRVGTTTRQRSWRQVGRRGYASDHGHGNQQSSEIPWIVGSAVVFFPSAAWLLGQGPSKSDHGHGEHHEEHEESEEKEEEEQPQEESKEEESKDEEPKNESKDEGEEKSDGGDEKADESDKKEEESSGKQAEEDEYESPGQNAPKQINWNSSMSKGPGEGQKGERKPSEKKGEKDSQGDFSGAKHPYLDDEEKSKKGVGVTETAKIHGTVDSRAPARGPKGEGSSSD